MLKRILSVLLLAALTCSFAACGGETGEPVSSNTPTDSVSADTDSLIDDKSKAESEAENTESTSKSNDNVEESDTDDKIDGYLKPPQGVEVIYGDGQYSSCGEGWAYSLSEWRERISKDNGKDKTYCVFIMTETTRAYKNYVIEYWDNFFDPNGRYTNENSHFFVPPEWLFAGINKYILATHPFTFEQIEEAYRWMYEADMKLLESYGIQAELHWVPVCSWWVDDATLFTPRADNVIYKYGFLAYVKGETLLRLMEESVVMDYSAPHESDKNIGTQIVTHLLPENCAPLDFVYGVMHTKDRDGRWSGSFVPG